MSLPFAMQPSSTALLLSLRLPERGRLVATSRSFGKLWMVLIPNRTRNHVAGFGLSADADRRDRQEVLALPPL